MTAHGTFRVRVTKDYLVFSSAHFITFAGHRCEALHGHNYRVGVGIDGTLDPESWYVLDFSVLKHLMKRLCDEIDHKVLLPLTNPKLTVNEQGDMVMVAYEAQPRYMFPRSDCALLPIPNTTVEMLAQYLARRVLAELPATVRVTAVEMEVEENFGQAAIYRELSGQAAHDTASTGQGRQAGRDPHLDDAARSIEPTETR
jgi:6-pyruvoyltetrahydropterin/6-carboxytetrahydropterin synthase